MPKFYVSSGDLRCTIDRENQHEAAIGAFQSLQDNPVDRLGTLTMVSEHGYDSEADDDMYFCTIDLLDKTDQLESYLHTEWMDA